MWFSVAFYLDIFILILVVRLELDVLVQPTVLTRMNANFRVFVRMAGHASISVTTTILDACVPQLGQDDIAQSQLLRVLFLLVAEIL